MPLMPSKERDPLISGATTNSGSAMSKSMIKGLHKIEKSLVIVRRSILIVKIGILI
jgi:hypothetical protein